MIQTATRRRWEIQGANAQDGHDVRISVEAASEREALQIAKDMGIYVSGARLIDNEQFGVLSRRNGWALLAVSLAALTVLVCMSIVIHNRNTTLAANAQAVQLLRAENAALKATVDQRGEAIAASTKRSNQQAEEIAGLRREMVLADRLQAELTSLRAENARLNADITKLKDAMATAAAAQERPGAGASADEIKKAIAEHRLVKGMTVAEAEKSLGVKLTQIAEGTEGISYEASVYNKGPNPIGYASGTKYGLIVHNGTVSAWKSWRFSWDHGQYQEVR